MAWLDSAGEQPLKRSVDGGWLLCIGAEIRNVNAKPTVFMTANETGVVSVTASAATSTAAMKPYVMAAVVDPSEVRWFAFEMCADIAW